MAKTGKQLDVQARYIYKPEIETCSHCGQRLQTRHYYQWRKTVRQLDGAVYVASAAKECVNAECPSRAKGCNGQPTLVAHPELLVPRRPNRPEWELDLFDLKRVDDYLATRTWIRTVSEVGQASLGSQR